MCCVYSVGMECRVYVVFYVYVWCSVWYGGVYVYIRKPKFNFGCLPISFSLNSELDCSLAVQEVLENPSVPTPGVIGMPSCLTFYVGTKALNLDLHAAW